MEKLRYILAFSTEVVAVILCGYFVHKMELVDDRWIIFGVGVLLLGILGGILTVILRRR